MTSSRRGAPHLRRTLSQVLADADQAVRSGHGIAAELWRTGLDPLDTYLGGGLRAGELTLLGGPQGLGKTTMALQMARNIAASGGVATYLSFEHGDQTLLERLLAMEAGLLAGSEALGLSRVREAMTAAAPAVGGLAERLGGVGHGAEGLRSLSDYAERLHLVRGSSGFGLPDLALLAAQAGRESSVLFVDYLQKVSVPGVDAEDERVTRTVEALKDLAMEHEVPILAVVAADRTGISGGRTRLHHLRGSTALAYEADVALLVNDKYEIVARHHLVYDPASAARFRNWVVLTIEKNRSGLDGVELQFRKRFDHGFFEPDGSPVDEQLVDDRVHVE